MHVRKGCLYKVLVGVSKFGELREEDILVYLGDVSDWMIYDRLPEYLTRRTYYFYHREEGTTVSWVIDGKENMQSAILDKHLLEVGGWPRPKSGEIIPIQPDAGDISNDQQCLRKYIPYFKSIAEGHADVENFYGWLERYDLILGRLLVGMDKLNLRMKPFQAICQWLDFFSIQYKVSSYYQWMDKIIF